MNHDELVSYVQEARRLGKTDAEIRVALGTHPGVTETQLSDALSATPAAPSILPEATMPLSSLSGIVVPPRPRRSVKKVVTGLVLVLLLLVAAGVAAAQYTGLYVFPLLPVNSKRVWNSFVGKTTSQPVHSEFNLQYTDAGSSTAPSPFGGVLKDIKAEVKGTSFTNGATDLKSLQSSSNLTYSLASGNTSFSTGLEYRLVGEALYVNVGQNPFLSSMMLGFSGGSVPIEGVNTQQKYEWIKFALDANSLQKLQQGMDAPSGDTQKLLDQQYWQELTKMWTRADLMEQPKLIGTEEVRGVQTLHFETNVKKDELRKALTSTVTKLLADTGDASDKQGQEEAVTMLNALVEKLTVHSVGLWIGQRDGHVYRVRVASNAPSVTSLVKAATDTISGSLQNVMQPCMSDPSIPCEIVPTPSAQERSKQFVDAIDFSASFDLNMEFFDYGKTQTVEVPQGSYDFTALLDTSRTGSRDAKRIADVRQLASALELSFNDNGKYPGRLEDVTTASPVVYLSMLPTASTPPDGNCTDAENAYAYTLVNPSEYKLTFCLGNATSGYSPGVHTLSPSGIQ